MAQHPLLQAALRAQQQGQPQQAATLYQRLLREQPGHPEGTLHYALLHAQSGQPAAALALLDPLAERFPDVPAVHINRAEILRRLGRFEEAIACLRTLIHQMPDQPLIRFNLALALRGAGHLDDAIREYQAVLQQNPGYADAWYNLGNTQLEAGHNDDALRSYEEALSLTPVAQQPRVLNNLGSTLIYQRRYGDAEAPLRRAIDIAPGYAEAHLNLGVTRERLGQIAEAATHFRRVATLQPAHWWHALRADILCPEVFPTSAAIDHWRQGFADTIARWREQPGQLDPAQLQHSGVEPPPTLMYQGREDRALKSAYADMLAPRLPAFEPPAARTGVDRYRIGFFVNHGHEAIFARSMLGIFQRLDRQRFEIVVAVTQPALQHTRTLLPIEDLRWLPLSTVVDQAAAQLRAAQLDLLYHWETGSDSGNYFMPWFRTAPVQCTSWGWPLTTGIPAMDYFLSSALVEPQDAQRLYREKLLCMPSNLFTWAEPPALPARAATRADFGFSERDHLYLCHQNPRKIHPDFDGLAAAILQRDPHARLLLIGSPTGSETAPLRARLQHHLGSLAERVHILPRMPREQYLSLVSLVDVALDPPHYTGANTSFDALGLGVPVVTLQSTLLRGNFTCGLYQQLGNTALVAHDAAHYIESALLLGGDPALRQHWRDTLLSGGERLFRDERAVSELETALLTMLAQR